MLMIVKMKVLSGCSVSTLNACNCCQKLGFFTSSCQMQSWKSSSRTFLSGNTACKEVSCKHMLYACTLSFRPQAASLLAFVRAPTTAQYLRMALVYFLLSKR